MALFSILILISFISLIPYFLVLTLKFILWKFSFTARVNGFFALKEILLKIPLHLDFAIMFRIESISLNF